MAAIAAAQAELCRLRRDIARIEGRLAEADRVVLDHVPRLDRASLKPRDRTGRLRLGFDALDRILGGGLPLATLHDIRAGESRDVGAAAGFVLALASRLAKAGGAPSLVWISEAGSRRETGRLYPPGLLALGLDPARIVQVAVRTQTEALWAFEAALACSGVGAAVCELRQASLDLNSTRRCTLRAREAGVTGFLLRLGSRAEPSAAELRFRLASAPAGRIGDFAAGVGRMAWQVALEKNRGGRTGLFMVEWNAHEQRFAERGDGQRRAHPQPLPAAPAHRPPAAAEAGGGGGIAALRRAS